MILDAMLRDHLVRGRPVLPAAASIELVAAALGLRRGRFEDIALLRPIVPPVEARLEIEGGEFRLLGAARERPFVTGRIGEPAAAPPPSRRREPGGEALAVDDVYAWFAELGLGYGPWFRTLREIRRDGHEVTARLVAERGGGFHLHPSILDGALQALGCVAFGTTGALFLPAGIDVLEWHDALASEVRVEARMVSVEDDLLRGEARLFDPAGRLLASLAGISIRRVALGAAATREKLVHRPERIVLPPAARPSPGSRSTAVHEAGRDEDAVLAFLRFAKEHPAQALTVIAELGSPESEAVLGAARALRLERPGHPVRAIAVAPRTPRARIDAELGEDAAEVILDGDARYGRRLVAAEPPAAPFSLPAGAVVIVTGGLGGIGLAIARRLFERHRARLVLVARRGLVAGSEAERAVDVLRARGASVDVVAADVTDREAMRAALADVRSRLGAIALVIHGAGIVRDAALARKTEEDARAVLGTKIRGAKILDELTAGDPLVTLVFLSSLVSYTGNLGQTDYAAANRWLDAYARRRRAEGRAIQSIAFGPWAEVGMAAPFAELARRRGIEPLSPDDAVAAFERALAQPAAEVVVAHVGPAVERAVAGNAVAEPTPGASPAPASASTRPSLAAGALERRLLDEIARFLEVEAEHLDVETDFQDFGIDSILAAQLLRDLERMLGHEVDPALFAEARTIRELAARLAKTPEAAAEPRPETRAEPRDEIREDASAVPARATAAHEGEDAVAVIGIAARLPGLRRFGELHDALLERRSLVREVPRERFDVDRFYDPRGERPGTTRSRWGGFLDDLELFDPLFFGISPREALLMDPQQRLLLDVAWDALEHAGYGPRLGGSRTGVFVAGGASEYGRRFLATPDAIDAHLAIGNSGSILANRISHAFDLKGPSLVVDTACSSALVALHLARESLLRGEADGAIVAGVNVLLAPELFVAFSHGRLLSPSGRSRPFSTDADGYVRAEAAVALLLKPLARARADGDTIHAILLGSAVTQDGRTASLTTPDLEAQAECMRRAWRAIDPGTIDHVEAHAVGNRFADAIELEAIARAGARATVGSIKGTVGHAEIASGLVAVAGAVLAFEKGVLPPGAPTDAGELAVRAERDGLRLLDRAEPLRERARVAVNAFGFGGTNASVLLERPAETRREADSAGEHLLLLSARSEAAFARTARALGEELARSAYDVADVCFTQSGGRKAAAYRAAALGDRAALAAALETAAPVRRPHRPRIAFLFTGQGSQYATMGRALFETSPVFRRALEHAAAILDGRLGRPLLELLFERESAALLGRTEQTQPALFALEWSIAETWKAAGVRPDVVIGHSVGELAAAAVAGAFSLEEGLLLAVERGRLLGALPAGGAMAAILATESDVRALVEPHRGEADLAAINGPRNAVVSGSAGAVDAIVAAAEALGFRHRRLAVSHAFHSPLVEPMLADFERVAASLGARTPRVALVSNLHGRVLGADERLDAVYWRRHVREPVRFEAGLHAAEADLFLEVGPDAVLAGMGAAALGGPKERWLASLRRGTGDRETMLGAAAALFVAGVDVDPSAIVRGRRVPSTPGLREPRRIWVDRPEPEGAAPERPPPASAAAPHPAPDPALRALLVEEAARVLGLEEREIALDLPLRSLGLDSILAIELAARIEGRLGRKIALDGFAEDASLTDLLAEGSRGEIPAAAGSGTDEPAAERPRPSAPPRLMVVKPARPSAARGGDLDAYARFARPATMERLRAVALDKVYVEARGDRMIHVESGERIEVLDLLGGFGSTLLGHNHPELVARARASLERAMPVHAQGAHHVHAGRLAEALSCLLDPARRFVSTFVSTGAEAVEAAIRHAETEHAARGRAILGDADKTMARALHDLGDLPIGPEIAAALGLGGEPRLSRAIEAATARNAAVRAERPVMLALERAFHGKTSGAARLTAGDDPGGWSALVVERLPTDDPSEVERRARGLRRTILVLEAHGGEVRLRERPWTLAAGLFVEPVQGEGGVRPMSPALVAAVRATAEHDGFPVVVDEIQSGFGRCGAFSAAAALGLRGDYYLFGKALGGGLAKIGVLMVDAERYREEFGLAATSTFSEDEPGITTALAALEIYERDGIEERARKSGDLLRRELEEVARRHPRAIREVRGTGLLIGVELSDLHGSAFLRHAREELGYLAASWFLNAARIRLLPMSAATGTIRLEPSAYLADVDRERVVAAFERFAEILEKGNVAHLLGPMLGVRFDPREPVRDWSDRPGPGLDEPVPGDARVAFLTYFTEESDLLDFCPAAIELPPAARAELVARLGRLVPPRVVRSVRVRARGGRAVHVDVIGLLATSEGIEAAMRAGDLGWIRDRLDEAVGLARDRGATVVGFGGLTSIVTHNARLAATRDVALTTGNALTVAMGLAAIERAALEEGIDLATAEVAIVGAAGNLGATYAAALAERSERILLVGRSASEERLRELSDALHGRAFDRLRAAGGGEVHGLARAIAQVAEIRAAAGRGDALGRGAVRRLVEERLGAQAPIRVTSAIEEVSRARVVLAASNASQPILEPEHLAPGPVVVCDVAVPRDVSPRVAAERPDVRVIVGGAVRLPEDRELDLVAGHLPLGHVYACMAETLLLGLEGHRGHFSFGAIDSDSVRTIAALAEKHGFDLAMIEDAAGAREPGRKRHAGSDDR